MNTTYLTGAGFLLLTAIFFGLLSYQFKQAVERTSWSDASKKSYVRNLVLVFLGWAVIVSIASLSGFTSRFEIFPLNAGPFLLIPLMATLIFVFSKKTKELLALIPTKVLYHLQVFRVFVELLLWALFLQQQVPEPMTFEGRNLDILSGIFGTLVALFFINNRIARLLYNILGLGLLINIVTIAILSMPTPFRVFMEEPANTIVFKWPVVFLPTFLVPLAYGLHFLALRQLSIKK